MARKNGGYIYPAHAGINRYAVVKLVNPMLSTPHTRG